MSLVCHSAQPHHIQTLTRDGFCCLRAGVVAWRTEVVVGAKMILITPDHQRHLVQIRSVQPVPEDPNVYKDLVLSPAW